MVLERETGSNGGKKDAVEDGRDVRGIGVVPEKFKGRREECYHVFLMGAEYVRFSCNRIRGLCLSVELTTGAQVSNKHNSKLSGVPQEP